MCECLMGEEPVNPGEMHMAVSGVNPGKVESGLVQYAKYSSPSSWS